MIITDEPIARLLQRKPPVPKRRTPKKAEMTVCIAALCENGRKVVVATDRRLSYGGIASDALPGKMFWFGDWLFLYAGVPSRVELVNEELRAHLPLDRLTIYDTVTAAYHRAKAKFCAHAVLSQYDLSMEEFKSQGMKMFGSRIFGRLCDEIETVGKEFNEQLLVVGYGKEENAGHIFEIGDMRRNSHALSGVAAIGSGEDVALSTLISLQQARSSSLGDTLYAVAAAKFSAEMSQVGDERDLVGKTTAMYIAWKRADDDKSKNPPGEFVQQDEISGLRGVWEQFGRPRVPRQSASTLLSIVTRFRQARSEPLLPEDMALRFAVEAQQQRRALEVEVNAQIRAGQLEEED